MKLPSISSFGTWLLRYIQLQLFITLISFPILIAWGLPISLLSFVGNLIFTPVLIVFLSLSSLIFFFQLCSIPNMLLIYLLEKVTCYWHFALALPQSHSFLIGFYKPSMFVLFAIPIITWLILQNKKTNSPLRSTICFLLLFFSTCTFLKYGANKQITVEEIPCNNCHITVFYNKEKITLIDPGAFGQKISTPSWIEFHLIPELIQKTGNNTIENLIILQPNKTTFEVIEKFCSQIQVKNIYLPYWKGTLNKATWRSFFTMKKEIEKHKTNVIRFKKRKIIELNQNKTLTITPTKQKITYQDATFYGYKVKTNFDNKKLIIYSTKIARAGEASAPVRASGKQ